MMLIKTPQPLETLQIPAELTGEQGRNRAHAPASMHISANNDLQAIK